MIAPSMSQTRVLTRRQGVRAGEYRGLSAPIAKTIDRCSFGLACSRFLRVTEAAHIAACSGERTGVGADEEVQSYRNTHNHD